jgi:hypothetical protein
MRAVPILLALAATACASHAAQQPRLDPAVAAALCEPNPDPATAKAGGCILKDQSRPAVARAIIVRPPQQ